MKHIYLYCLGTPKTKGVKKQITVFAILKVLFQFGMLFQQNKNNNINELSYIFLIATHSFISDLLINEIKLSMTFVLINFKNEEKLGVQKQIMFNAGLKVEKII